MTRDVVFLSKATPGDDEFALWLAPRLEAEGYTVFADILALEPGDRWRKEVTRTLQDRAAKMLLCCRDSTLAKDGVQEEIGIALDLAKELKDSRFIIPLRLEQHRKLFGIGELQRVDFVRGWAEGLAKLLDALRRQKVPRKPQVVINPNWELFRRRRSVLTKNEPERLTSNWLRLTELPDVVRFYEPKGFSDQFAVAAACAATAYPSEPFQRGFFSFGTEEEVNQAFVSVGRFTLKHEIDPLRFAAHGSDECEIKRQDASNLIHSMLRQSWESYCRQRNLLSYKYSKETGFHISDAQLKLGQRVPWGRQGEHRSSMLRNVAKGHIWQFGVTGQPALWPFPHFKLKSRVLFALSAGPNSGDVIDDAKRQHRLRRTVCKGWRNKQWHGRLRAFVELLSGESSYITLPLAANAVARLEAAPVLFSSPVSTYLPDIMSDEDEELDVSTLGRPEIEDVVDGNS